MGWRLLVYRIPAEPSRHRVAVWRELRRAGAVSLQAGTWALPDTDGFDAALVRAVGIVDEAGGEAFTFSVTDDNGIPKLIAAFNAERESEWAEFLAECGKFAAELEHEIAIEKFTLAELDEEEQNHERLRRWFREIRARDAFGAPSASLAEQRLKECADDLEHYADLVYQARQSGS